MSLSITRVASAPICPDELYCPLDQSGVTVAGTTNAVNARQSQDRVKLLRSPYFFRPFTAHAINPTAPTHPRVFQFYSPSFAHIERPRWRPAELNDRDLGSCGQIGNYEQCKNLFSFTQININV